MNETTEPLWVFPRPLQAAAFVRRPHRFATTCLLEADGREVDSHLADPGRLREILVPGARLFVDGPFPPPRKLAYSTILAETGGTLVSLVSTLPNRVFPELLARGLLSDVLSGKVEALRSEVKHGKSRMDFEVTDSVGPILVECKGVGLRVDEHGMFPDAPSSRALKHVRELEAHVESGGRAVIAFIAGRGDVLRFTPARHIDPDFADALAAAAEAGVVVVAHSLRIERSGVYAGRRLPVDL